MGPEKEKGEVPDSASGKMAADNLIEQLGFVQEKDGRWSHSSFRGRFRLEASDPSTVVLQLYVAFSDLGYAQCQKDARQQMGIEK